LKVPDIGYAVEKTILVNADGTLYPFRWPGRIGSPHPGVVESLRRLKAAGWRIVIHTARASEVWPQEFRRREVAKVERFLRKYGVPCDKITADKEPSEHVVDDRAIAFDRADAWPSIADRILGGKDRGPRPEGWSGGGARLIRGSPRRPD
jgi:hypothetical protein